MALELLKREPYVSPRQAPRSVALEVSKVARDENEAALLLVMAWHEGRFMPEAIGDGGESLCTMQIKHDRRVLHDLSRCIEKGAAKLRASADACPAHPLAVYASGRCDWAWGISDRRMAEARALLP
jgi:hypothetical protein